MNPVDEFLKNVEPKRKAELERLRKIALANIPNPNEIISYRMPTITSGGKPIIGFYPYEHHIGVYPYSGSVINKIKELDRFPQSIAAVRETLENLIPEDVIIKMINEKLRQSEIKF